VKPAHVLRQASRASNFVRHIPVNKLAMRVNLLVRRRVRDYVGGAVGAVGQGAVPARRADVPMPLFAPRARLAPLETANGLRFTFLGHGVQMPAAGIDWSLPGPQPKFQLWRMNLHYMEFLEGTSNAQFGPLVEAWIRANPANARGTWRDSWNSYALSLRAVVWMQELARRAQSLPGSTVERIEQSLAQQLRFLEQNLETDIGGNHLIKNIKALIWASAYFAGPDAERWRDTGRKLLARELDAQILPDGLHYERSHSYHVQVFADLMECRHALGTDPLDGRLDDCLARMAQATADLAHPDGGPALFNDAGLSMAYPPAECLDVYERLFGHRPEARGVFSLADGGYFGLRSHDAYLVADCGRIAPDDLPAHGHADVLGFEWSAGGKRIIVDQGVFEYNAGPRRQDSRSAVNHNTLCFAGADQADFFGAFRCGRRPNVKVLDYKATTDGFILEGTHDGFGYLPGAPSHVRRFVVGPRALTITDRILGQPDRVASLGFLLHPDVSLTISDDGVILAQGSTSCVVTTSQPIRIEDAVWWPDMGIERPTRRLRVDLGPGVREVVTKFRVESV